MADDKLRKMDGKGSAAKVAATNEVLDTPKARNSYYDKAKSSKDRATNSAVANILRKSDHSADLKTRSKREKGIGMVKNKAINALRKEESVNELSKDTMQSYWDKTKGDDAFSGSRKANNRLKGAINVTTKLDRLKKMGNRKKVKSMEATQVDEISKDTKKSYIKKAVGDIDNRSFAQGLRDKNPTYTSVDSKNNRKIANRRKGIDRALEAKETDPPFDNAKPIQKDTKDKFGNLIKNRAKHLARKTARDLANKEK
jgi:hypothetical protein